MLKTKGFAIFIAIMVASCTNAAGLEPTGAAQVTNTVPSPTETKTPTPTATPDPVISSSSAANLIQTLAFGGDQLIMWSPQGHIFGKYNEDDSFSIWEAGEATPLLEFEAPVDYAAWSPTGKYLAIYQVESEQGLLTVVGNVRILEISAEWNEVGRLDGHTHPIEGLVFSPDSESFISHDFSGLVLLWHMDDSRSVINLEGQSGYHVILAWSPDSSMFVSAKRSGYTAIALDGTARLLSAEDGKVLAYLKHPDYVRRILWSPDNTALATIADDNTVRVWRGPSGENLAVLPDQTAAIWATDGEQLITSGSDGTITFWDATSWEAVKTVNGQAARFVWSPDGSTLGFVQDGSLRLLDGESGVDLMALGEGDNVRIFSWSPNGTLLAGGNEQGLVFLWDASNGELLATLETNQDPVYRLSWSADGQALESYNVAYDSEKDEIRTFTIIWINSEQD